MLALVLQELLRQRAPASWPAYELQATLAALLRCTVSQRDRVFLSRASLLLLWGLFLMPS